MKKQRNLALDFLKIIATTIIIFHHYQQVTGAFFYGKINFYNGKFPWEYIVELFFIISGFLTFKYIKKINDNKINLKEFFLKRLLRFAPLLLAGAVVYEIIIIIYKNLYNSFWLGIRPNLWGTIIDTLGIQAGWSFPNPFVNNPTWCISVLLLCYVIFYISTKIAKKYNFSPYYAYIFIILIGCGVKTYGIELPFLNVHSCRGFYSFFAGLILAKFLKDKKISWRVGLISLLVICLFTFIFVKHSDLIPSGIEYLLTFVIYPAFIILLSTNIFNKIFNFKIISKLSEISYNVFIWHNPMLPALFVAIKLLNKTPNFNRLCWMLLFALIAWIVGIISHYSYSIPMKKATDKIAQKLKIGENYEKKRRKK